jgi:DNA invertase Pin-like site-specific DNA recombinase
MIRRPRREAAFRVPKVGPKTERRNSARRAAGGARRRRRSAGRPPDTLRRRRRAGIDDRTQCLEAAENGRKESLRSALGSVGRLSQVAAIATPRLVGYARVSTDEQTTRLQLDALRAAGCAVIHEDAASGVSRSRPGLGRALADLAAGDTLVVWRLDRLGRSLRDLLDISEMLRKRDVALRSLSDHIDTAAAAGRMLYAVLGAVAQFEHDALRERTVAGMRAAKRRGEHIGRPTALSPAQVREAKKMLDRGESPNHVARILRVGPIKRCTAIWHSDGSAAYATLHRPFKYVLGGPEREQAREQAVASQPKTAAKLTNRIS